MRTVITIIFIVVNVQPYIEPTSATPPSTTSTATACVCPIIRAPVCGTDGKTYSSKCILGCANRDNARRGLPIIGVKSQNECPPKTCICPAVVLPVCGIDGHTYGNECILGCENKRRKRLRLPLISVAHKGPCSPTPCNCPDIIIPVCGTDNKTYRNICFLRCADRDSQVKGLPPIEGKSYGACPQESCICPLLWDPVCASDGRTYENECLLVCENRRRHQLGLPRLTVLHKGECLNCVCSAIYDPVCATDGRTYENTCAVVCENKRKVSQGKPPLNVIHRGECTCNCTNIYQPICAIDGNTYRNPCLLGCENIRRLEAALPTLSVWSAGECYCNCPPRNDPVCGNNNRTYRNICWLKCNSERKKNQGLPPIIVAKVGPCDI